MKQEDSIMRNGYVPPDDLKCPHTRPCKITIERPAATWWGYLLDVAVLAAAIAVAGLALGFFT
uniref:Uncharacterized protein n=1 Tax=viral metagenome TaxID=1070528 RepID=A0A6M3KVE9_9ZZZZ